MSYIVVLGVLGVLAGLAGAGVGAGLGALPAQAASTFQAATARVEITPSALGFAEYYRGGYGGDEPEVIISGSRLYATGLLLVTTGGQRWAIVSAEILGFPASVVARITANAQSRYGIAPQRLLLSGTHTHTGPVVGDQPNTFVTYNIAPGTAADQRVKAYTRALEARIDSLLAALVAAPAVTVSATFGYGVGTAGMNRSALRGGVVEPTIGVLTLRATGNGRILAVAFSYGVHATAAGLLDQWSGDFPAGAVAIVESQLSAANPGVRALFLQGGYGDQGPKAGLSPANVASMLASQVLAAVAGGVGTGNAAVSEPESAGFRDVAAPLDIRVSDATLRARYVRVLSTSASIFDRNHAQLMIQQIDSGTLRRAMMFRVTAWRFGSEAGVGPLALVAFGGEPVADISIGVDKILGIGFRAWPLGQTNGHPGYMISDEILNRGDGCPASGCFYAGYEAGWDVVEGGQRYPAGASIIFNDGLVAPLAAGADNAVCRATTEIITGASADCTGYTPGRVIPHAPLVNTGPAVATWTDSAGRNHLEVLVLGTNGCLQHRGWIGGPNGAISGTWTRWRPTGICGGIVGPTSVDAWVDPSGRLHLELVVRTGDSSLFHGRCTGDVNGCLTQPWTWIRIGNSWDGFVEPPELSVLKQADGRPRIDVFAARNPGRCLYHLSWISSDTNGNGSWGGAWEPFPGCGGIVGPAAAASWRTDAAVRHDVVVRTTDGRLFADRCTGTEDACTWSSWTTLSGPPGVGVVDAPAYTASGAAAEPRFDLVVRGSDNCLWHAAWTSPAIPISPTWRKIEGCGLASRPGIASWTDSFGRSRAALLTLDRLTGGPLWWQTRSSVTTNPAGDIWIGWEDIADPVYRVSEV